MIKNIFSYLNRKDLSSFFLLIILIIFGSLLEIMSIGTIPVFLKLALSPSDLIEKSPIDLESYLNISNFDQNDLIIFFSIILFSIFAIKNIYLFVIHYFQQKR